MVAMTDFDFIRHAHNTDGLGQYLHPIHKFGHNPALSNTAYESVWTAGGLYPWSAFDAGGQNIFAKSLEKNICDGPSGPPYFFSGN